MVQIASVRSGANWILCRNLALVSVTGSWIVFRAYTIMLDVEGYQRMPWFAYGFVTVIAATMLYLLLRAVIRLAEGFFGSTDIFLDGDALCVVRKWGGLVLSTTRTPQAELAGIVAIDVDGARKWAQLAWEFADARRIVFPRLGQVRADDALEAVRHISAAIGKPTLADALAPPPGPRQYTNADIPKLAAATVLVFGAIAVMIWKLL